MDDDGHLDERNDGLDEIVAGLVADPVPNDLKQQIRSGLGERFESRTSSSGAWNHAVVAAAVAVVAALVGAIIFLLPSSQTSVTAPDSVDVVAAPAETDSDPVRRQPHVGPSLWTYHRASHDSVDQINSLLREHAGAVLSADNVNLHAAPMSTSQFLEEI